MGSDAEVFVFDYTVYTTVVAPAFFELFRKGQVPGWLQPAVKRRELEPSLCDRTDLIRFTKVLKPDLSWVGPYDLKSTYDQDWRTRWSYSNEGLNDLVAPSEKVAEAVNWLFKVAVSLKCLGASQFVGRSMTVSQYSKTLADFSLKENDRIVELLAALGKRAFIIGYQFGFGVEGINGWLDPSETEELATRLAALPLPRYEVSFAAMKGFQTAETGHYECHNFSFEALSLSFVRTVAKIAAAESRGVLWGSAVMPSHYYRGL